MKEKIKNIFKNQIVKLLMLLLLWFMLTILYVITFDTSFSIWSYNHKNSNIINLDYNPFYKNKTLKGSFIAQDNNLGIVAIRFETYVRPPFQMEDKYLFKLKQKGEKKWYYVNVYRSGLIYDIPFFPFGFPQIENSKGKTYQFEITSTDTNSVNQLSISRRYPILQSKYKYSGPLLLQNKYELVNFLKIKFSNAFKTPDVIFSSFIYLLPFIFYLSWISFLVKIVHPVASKINILIEKIENTSIGLLIKLFFYNLDYFLIFIVFIDTLIIRLTNDIAYIVISILWIITLKVYRKNIKESFITALVLISFCPFFLLLGLQPIAEKFSIWAFVFLVSGTIQTVIESKTVHERRSK